MHRYYEQFKSTKISILIGYYKLHGVGIKKITWIAIINIS